MSKISVKSLRPAAEDGSRIRSKLICIDSKFRWLATEIDIKWHFIGTKDAQRAMLLH